MSDAIKALLTSVSLIALATTLVLPGRTTANILKALFAGLTNVFTAVIGK